MPKGWLKYTRFAVYIFVLAASVWFYLQAQSPKPQIQTFRVTPNMITPMAPAEGLGVPRSAVRPMLEAGPFNVNFVYAPMDDGRSRYIGRPNDNALMVELVGPPQDMTHVILYLRLPPDDEATTLKNFTAMLNVTDMVLPAWPEAEEWISRNLNRALNDGVAETTAGNARVQMKAGDRPGSLVLSIAGAVPTFTEPTESPE